MGKSLFARLLRKRLAELQGQDSGTLDLSLFSNLIFLTLDSLKNGGTE